MGSQATPSSTALRRRFLMESPERIAEWLWGEHPQTAAFFLNWMGDPRMARAYLGPLTHPQQADALCRLSYFETETAPDPVQEELLVEALRQISPSLREMSEPPQEPAVPYRGGLNLVQSYLDHLDDAAFTPLVAEMADVDRNLARLCQRRRRTREQGDANPHALLNTFCDVLAYRFNRRLTSNARVYLEALELLSAEALMDEAVPGAFSFRAVDEAGRQPLLLQFSPRLLYHHLELFFGAPRPFPVSNFNRPVYSSLESHVAISFADELLRAFVHAASTAQPDMSLRAEGLPSEALFDTLRGMGQQTVAHAEVAVMLGGSHVGKIALLLLPGPLKAMGLMDEESLYAGLVPAAERPDADALVAPSGADGGSAPRQPEPSVREVVEVTEAAEDDEGHHDEALLQSTLEDLLFDQALEEAEQQQSPPRTPDVRPLDFLLRGYQPAEVDDLASENEAVQRKLAEVHYYYGTLLFQRDQYAEATEALEQALRCDPQHDNARLLYAASSGEMGHYFQEIVAYRRMIAEEVCLPEAHVLLARRLSHLGKADEAVEALKEALVMGFNPQEIVESDACFANVRRNNRWLQLMNAQT